MSAQHTPGPAKAWSVFVHTEGVDYIGAVAESNEELARCAALSKFSDEGNRSFARMHNRERRCAIYESDDFDVRPA